MAKTPVPINAAVLAWARREGGYSRQDLADALGVEEGLVEDWETGVNSPSKGEFSALVKKLARPSAVFFLPEAPTAADLKVSLRAAPGAASRVFAPKERTQVRWAQAIQSAVASVETGDPILLPEVALNDAPREAGEAFRERVGPAWAEQLAWDNEYEAFRAWRRLLEELGVLVLQLSFGEEAARGFSIWDERAPLVAVNRSYSMTARIFSLFHEVAHLVTRTNSVCPTFAGPIGTTNRIERWAEQFSAGFLLPGPALRAVARDLGVTPSKRASDVQQARRVARRFKVSARAAALALIDQGLAAREFYAAVDAALRKTPRRDGGGRGEKREKKRLSELGTRATGALLRAADERRLTERDVARYLRLTTNQVDELRILARAAGD